MLWSAQRMDVPAIAKIAFTSEDRVREVIHNFNADGFDSLAPATPAADRPSSPCRSGSADQADRPRPAHRLRRALLHVVAHQAGRPPGAKGGGRRHQPRGPALSSPRGGRLLSSASRPGRQSNDPDFEIKKNRILELYAIADGKGEAQGGAIPTSSSVTTSSGPSTSSPTPGKALGDARHQGWLLAQAHGGGCGPPITPAPRGPPSPRRL